MIRSWRLALVLCFATVTVHAHAGLVAAQEDPAHSASARTLFEEGIQLAEQGQWRDATDRFRRALALRDSPVIRFNLAAALAELDQVVEASELLRGLLRTPGLDATVQAQAEERLAQTSRRIAKLHVQVTHPRDGSRVELDGRVLPPALLDVAMPVDPGSHSARLVHGDTELDLQQLDLAAGESGTLTLAPKVPSPQQTAQSAVADPAPGPAVLPGTHSGPREDHSGPDQRKKRMWWGIGGGAVALVAGAVIAGVLLSHRSKSADPYAGDFEPGSVSVKVNP